MRSPAIGRVAQFSLTYDFELVHLSIYINASISQAASNNLQAANLFVV